VIGSFRTKDSYICLIGVDDKRWPRFCEIMGIQYLQNDPECDNVARHFHGTKITRVFDDVFPSKTTVEWLESLTEADILATDVADYRQVLNSEQARTNGYVMGLEHPTAGKINVTGCPVSHEAASAEQPWNLSFPTPKRHRLFLYVLCHSV
jgi:crotonobetainyl-CoA:carnitine CoA-transferase CaiB-like acyl-CoA transferase